MISATTYLAAKMVAAPLEAHFAGLWLRESPGRDGQVDAGQAIPQGWERQLQAGQEAGWSAAGTGTYHPSSVMIEALIDVSFWASLRKEEGYSPQISLAFLHPGHARNPLIFGQKLRFNPYNLVKLSPAVTRPGIHLGVWYEGNDLYIWGSTHEIPERCFVLEVVEPGLLVVKHKQSRGFGKFVNVAILKGDQIKLVDENIFVSTCTPLLDSLLGIPQALRGGDSINVLVELAASIRAHGRGALVLVVPPDSDKWMESVVHPISYPVVPPYRGLTQLMSAAQQLRGSPEWQDAFTRAMEITGGFTAVDGATVITRKHELLAFGVKVARAASSDPAEQVMVTEPVSGAEAQIIHPAKMGGTRHLAAAQFVHDQHDSMALVASQDGRFTVFIWSEELQMVHAHSIEVLLL